MESFEIRRWGRAVWIPRSANKVASGSWSKLSLRPSLEAKMTTLGKTEESRTRGGPDMRWIDSVREATGVSPQELSGAGGARTLWTSRIPGVTGSGTRFKGT